MAHSRHFLRMRLARRNLRRRQTGAHRDFFETMINAAIEDCGSNALALLAEGHLKLIEDGKVRPTGERPSQDWAG